MDLNQRRDQLITTANPNSNIDYITSLEAKFSDLALKVTVRYIPDKVILAPHCLTDYIQSLHSQAPTLEEIAATLLDDLNNQLVARWVQIYVDQDQDDQTQHRVVVEDQQPQWSNPHLVARIRPI